MNIFFIKPSEVSYDQCLSPEEKDAKKVEDQIKIIEEELSYKWKKDEYYRTIYMDIDRKSLSKKVIKTIRQSGWSVLNKGLYYDTSADTDTDTGFVTKIQVARPTYVWKTVWKRNSYGELDLAETAVPYHKRSLLKKTISFIERAIRGKDK